jgi:archaellum biogenesis ATPase FlaH
MGAILDAALEYAEAGYAVIPVKRSDKTPYTENGLLDASTDSEVIRKWWKKFPSANVAIACGNVSGNLFAIDVDIKPEKDKHGDFSLENWQANFGRFPETVIQKTGSGGLHYFFRCNRIAEFKNKVEAIPAVDIRGDGAYVVVSPSIYEDGRTYEWEHGVSITDKEEVAEANDSVIKLLELNRKNAPKSPTDTAQPFNVRNAKSGNRNDTIFRFASGDCGRGVPYDICLEEALKLNERYCDPPLDDNEVIKTVQSAYKYEPDAETIFGSAEDVGEDGAYKPKLPAELSREFLLNPPPPKDPIVEGFLREGEAMLLSGNPKAGKSYLIVQLALSIAIGSKWLGKKCKKYKVLYIDGELTPETTAERIADLRKLMAMNYFPENLHVINTKRVSATLKDVADDFTHGVRSENLVIIDPLYLFIDSDENDNSQMKKEMEQIRRITSTGTAVVVVHHMAKGIQSGKLSIDRASGAGVLGRFFDSILTLNLLNIEPTDPARPERVEADTRSFMQPNPINLWFDGHHYLADDKILGNRELFDPKKSAIRIKNADDAGKLNHCYVWMKENNKLRPDGGFTIENMQEAIAQNYKPIARTTLTGQLERAGYIKKQGRIEDASGGRIVKRIKNIYYPDGAEIKEDS